MAATRGDPGPARQPADTMAAAMSARRVLAVAVPEGVPLFDVVCGERESERRCERESGDVNARAAM